MKAKKGAYVKRNDKEDNFNQLQNELLLTEQLELLADILIDQYLETLYEEDNELKEQPGKFIGTDNS